MVLPLIGALLGAGGSIGSALLGASAQDEAWQWNNYINERNLREQRKARQETIDYAEKLRGDQHLGGTDALGNRTYFKEGEGWVTDLSPEQQDLYDYFFEQELPERQDQFWRKAQQSRDNADQANQLLDQFKRVRKDLPYEAEAQLYETAARGIREGTRDATEAASRNALRMGSSNAADVLSKIAATAMDKRKAARTDAALQAEDYANDKFNAERAGLAQLYQMFLGNSQGELGASYDPTGLPGQANQLMSMFSQQGQQGNAGVLNAMSQPLPIRKNIEPNLSSANAFGAIGSSLAGLGERMGSMSQKDEMNDLLKMYMTGGGQLSLDGGGIFGRQSDRLAANRSSF